MIEIPSLTYSQDDYSNNSRGLFDGESVIENTLRQGEGHSLSKPISCSPTVPQSGLPEGWSIEQWNYYGAQWLESRNMYPF